MLYSGIDLHRRLIVIRDDSKRQTAGRPSFYQCRCCLVNDWEDLCLLSETPRLSGGDFVEDPACLWRGPFNKVLCAVGC
jgi:hypothetical protein